MSSNTFFANSINSILSERDKYLNSVTLAGEIGNGCGRHGHLVSQITKLASQLKSEAVSEAVLVASRGNGHFGVKAI